ncbi:MAG TPA: hypothetical protein VKW78_12025 [Terriglobales bacterium]|nr:hypothetical protein [Terriglobales bacterium]
MRKAWALVIVVGCGLVGSTFGQSLGDFAREQRAKQGSATATKKVITDDDIPKQDTISTGGQNSPNPQTNAGSLLEKKDKPAQADSAADKLKSAEQCKAAIQQQKQTVDSMQKELDELKGSIHYVEANAYYNGVQYNEAQAQKQKEAEHLEKQLTEEKAKLQDMQEQARKAGFGSSVYE